MMETAGNYFNPRSREGSDDFFTGAGALCDNFNPRSREGSDGYYFHLPGDSTIISIHAPARGATSVRRLVPMCQNNFNPRSREGSDLTGVQFDLLADRFQSTLPRGERRLLLPDRLLVPPSFQSTLPRGERLTCDGPVLPVRGFQSTLPRGERPVWTRHSGGQAPFQSTLPRGERRRNNIVIPSSSLFQSTLPRGERQKGGINNG